MLIDITTDDENVGWMSMMVVVVVMVVMIEIMVVMVMIEVMVVMMVMMKMMMDDDDAIIAMKMRARMAPGMIVRMMDDGAHPQSKLLRSVRKRSVCW